MSKTLIDRFEDFIILNSGRKIYPEEIEEFYTKTAPIKEMCVFTVIGMDGARKSKVLWAVIQPDLDEFRKFAVVNLHLAIKERFDQISLSLRILCLVS
jgi:long-subunit acyl-CoA synthetase (AMP-forming)